MMMYNRGVSRFLRWKDGTEEGGGGNAVDGDDDSLSSQDWVGELDDGSDPGDVDEDDSVEAVEEALSGNNDAEEGEPERADTKSPRKPAEDDDDGDEHDDEDKGESEEEESDEDSEDDLNALDAFTEEGDGEPVDEEKVKEYQERVKVAREQSIQTLMDQYEVSEEEADLWISDPAKAVKKFRAELFLDTYGTIVGMLPQMMGEMMPSFQDKVESKARVNTRFFQKWPALADKKHRDEVKRISKTWLNVNKGTGKTQEDYINEVGLMAHASLGIPIEDVKAKPKAGAKPPRKPPGSGKASGKAKAAPKSGDWIDDMLDDED